MIHKNMVSYNTLQVIDARDLVKQLANDKNCHRNIKYKKYYQKRYEDEHYFIIKNKIAHLIREICIFLMHSKIIILE